MPIDWKKENAQHFEAHANESLQPLYNWFLTDVELVAKRSVAGLAMLDIGCGPGFMLETLVKAGASVVAGVDLSYSMLECAVRSGRSDQAMLLQADVSRLPFRPASFDIVFSRGSIFFWQNLETAFKSIATALKPGGFAILGGGYGLSTPQHLVDAARSRSGSGQARTIPRIDHDLLLELAKRIGGEAEIKAAPKRGFWLIWHPHFNR